MATISPNPDGSSITKRSATYTALEIASMKRADLQKLCKDVNIKANLRTDQLVELLQKELVERPISRETTRGQTTTATGSVQSDTRKPRPLRKSLSQPVLVPNTGTLGHSRTDSKDSVKPTIARPQERRQIPSVTLNRKPSAMEGKENGVLGQSSTRGVKGLAGPSGTVSKGIAGKIAVFGRAIGANTKTMPESNAQRANISDSVISRKTQALRQPQKPGLTSTTFAEPTEAKPKSPPVIEPSWESRLEALEISHTSLLAIAATLQQNADIAQASVEAARVEHKSYETRMADKDGEIQRLRDEMEETRVMAEEQAAANEELRQMVSDLSEQLAKLEGAARTVGEDVTALSQRTVQLESTCVSTATLETVVNKLVEGMAQISTSDDAGPAVRERSQTPSMQQGRRKNADGSPFVPYHPHAFMDLQFPPTPSTRRRDRLWGLEFGHDALASYNGYGPVESPSTLYDAVDACKISIRDTREARSLDASIMSVEAAQYPDGPSSYGGPNSQQSPIRSTPVHSRSDSPEFSGGEGAPRVEQDYTGQGETSSGPHQHHHHHHHHHQQQQYFNGNHDEDEDEDDGFYGGTEGRPDSQQIDTPAPPQPPPSHYQNQQQQQLQYRRRAEHQHQQEIASRRQSAAPAPHTAPALPPPIFDHSHLRPGNSASLLSAEKTLEMYRVNAKKTNDPEIQFQFAILMLEAIRGPAPAPDANATQYDQEKINEQKEKSTQDATRMLQKLADRGHHEAQYFLADCYANGIGTPRGRQDFDKAYPLFVQAAKHRHADAAYRAGICCENGWGCRRDSAKAIQFYKTAGSMQHPGAMYRLGLAELNGELGQSKKPKEGVKWLKRSAEHATAEFPHALHELALLHERGIDNVLFVDMDYSAELLAQAAELGYAPSAHRLGECYEYGKMGCPMDPALSIHYYNIAAQQDHRDACFALTAWYLVGSPGVLPQSDTEAYLWAKKAAEGGLAKAMYAVGYFTEVGIGTAQSTQDAVIWYKRAAEAGDKRASQRLRSNDNAGPLPGAPLGDRIEIGSAGQGGGNHGMASGKGKDKECIIM
ncbi:hypothetical protein FRB98_008990 [Tulasnella sp. 332]|nr:hypothetical protein FRB98_008990 [Tulasnella sp. 332]